MYKRTIAFSVPNGDKLKIVLGQLGEYECRNDDTLIIDQTWLGYRFPLIQDMLNDFPDQDDIEIPMFSFIQKINTIYVYDKDKNN